MEHGKEITVTCFCKATLPVSGDNGAQQPQANGLKRALQHPSENNPGEPNTPANGPKGNSQELLISRGSPDEDKGVQTVAAQPLAPRATPLLPQGPCSLWRSHSLGKERAEPEIPRLLCCGFLRPGREIIWLCKHLPSHGPSSRNTVLQPSLLCLGSNCLCLNSIYKPVFHVAPAEFLECIYISLLALLQAREANEK